MGKPLEVGDLVVLRKHEIDKQRSRKWEERWEGPYVIMREVKRQCSYILATLDGTKVRGRYSIDSLKPYLLRRTNGRLEACKADIEREGILESRFRLEKELIGSLICVQ